VLIKLKYLSMVVGLVFCLCQNASAELAAVGPINSTNRFPSWYMDENGVALELCLNSTFCVFDPIVGTPFSTRIGFGENAFYWSASATLSGAGANGSLNMALVASFSGSTTAAIPVDGEQITFFQITVGPLTGLAAGSVYTVTHPYGVLTNLVADSSGTISVQRQDVGCAAAPCDFTAVLGSAIGPFLQWDTGAPAGFIGNPATPHKVIGSPSGTNIFRIDGPNAGGAGVNTKQTDLFKVQGNLFTGTVPAPLVVNRATYTRPLPSAVNVSATSAPTAVLRVSGTGITTTAMRGDGNGNFFAHIPLAGAPPDVVTVAATNPPNTATTIKSGIVDVVSITLAEYNSDLRILTIEASSSDQVTHPTLTAVGFGNLTAGKRVVTGLLVPPTEVTVTSSAGGSDTAQVTVTANIKPIARNDTALTLKNTAVVINVLANDTAVSGDLDPTTVTVVTPPAHGTASPNPVTGEVTYTPNLDFVGKDSFKYTVDGVIVIDGVSYPGLTSNVATVNITVVAGETLSVTKAVFTTASKLWQISGKSTVKSGNIITLYVGTDTSDSGTVIGTAPVNLLGSWSFSKLHSSVDPGGAASITAVSTLGTEVTFLLTIK
jgi:hypothetical protein